MDLGCREAIAVVEVVENSCDDEGKVEVAGNIMLYRGAILEIVEL
jgi:hypothetical protein